MIYPTKRILALSIILAVSRYIELPYRYGLRCRRAFFTPIISAVELRAGTDTLRHLLQARWQSAELVSEEVPASAESPTRSIFRVVASRPSRMAAYGAASRPTEPLRN